MNAHTNTSESVEAVSDADAVVDESAIDEMRLAARWSWQGLKDAVRYGISSLIPWQCADVLHQAAREKPLLACILLTWMQGVSFCFALYWMSSVGVWTPSPVIKRLPNAYWVLGYALFFYPVYWFLRAAVINLTAELMGAPPRGLSIMCSSACALSPFLLYLPMAAFLRLAAPEMSAGAGYFWVLFVLLTIGHTGLLLYVAVRETYDMGLARALLTLLIPGLVTLLLGFIAYWAGLWLLD